LCLAEKQQQFSNLLFDSHNEHYFASFFKGDMALTEQRFALYRGNLSATWEKTLSAAYPVLKTLVGEEFFNALTKEYGKLYPSEFGDLNLFGDHFADFLADFPHVAQYPYFPDMARLEWSLHRAHYAPDPTPLDFSELMCLPPDQLDEVQLVLQPLCTIFASEWAIVDLWLAHQTTGEIHFPSSIRSPNYGLVIRPQWRSDVLPLSAPAHEALSKLQQGNTLGTALDAAFALDEAFDFGAYLQQWMQHGVFSDRRNHTQ